MRRCLVGLLLSAFAGASVLAAACNAATSGSERANGDQSSGGGLNDATDSDDARVEDAAAYTPMPDGGGDGSANIYTTPLVCTSKSTWTGGESGSPLMHPGRACITCHAQQGGPGFTIAGTIYPTAHEPDDCYGVAGPLTVIVTGANNETVNVSLDGAGNFYSSAMITPPFQVKVTNGTQERVMTTAVTEGDCNRCHTTAGAAGAPGRVMAP